MKKIRSRLFPLLGTILILAGCAAPRKTENERTETTPLPQESEPPVEPAVTEEPAAEESFPTLLYQGHASLRITTSDGKVIYIDPYAGEGYGEAADLILITHGHYDHNNPDLVTDRNEDCQIITWREALENGTHNSFDLGYVSIESLEAANANHSPSECVGYLLTFPGQCRIYISGDTSKTEEMKELAGKDIDYAFFCCDGIYNMSPQEAGECAALLQAAHSIPYHVSDAGAGFSRANAEAFEAEGRIILAPGDTLEMKKE